MGDRPRATKVFERDILTTLRRNVPEMDDITRALLTCGPAALRQIDEKDYPAALRAEGVAEIVKIGLAYRRKRVELALC